MTNERAWRAWFAGRAIHEQALIALSLILVSFLIIDPLIFSTVKGLDPGLYRSFREITHIGRSNWILIPSGAAILILAWLRARSDEFRRTVIYGYVSQLLVYVFVTVAVSGLSASLMKNVLGRARPKLYEKVGPLEFEPFTFDSDFASFPSGHATTAGALTGILILFFPRAKIPVLIIGAWVAASRVMLGAHYFSDAVAGYLLGIAFAVFIASRLANKRWLFERDGSGVLRLRGQRLLHAAIGRIAGLFSRFDFRSLSEIKTKP